MINLQIKDLSQDKIDFEKLYQSLPIDIKQRVDRYKIEDDRRRSIVAWSIVHEELDLNNNKLLINEYGKPYIINKYFSISHSNNLVGVLFTDNECGFDIEMVSYRNEKLANKILNNVELVEYKNNPDILTKKWTKIEAYSKAIGTGFKYDLINKLPDNITTKIINDNQENKYYYSIYVGEERTKIF